ASKRTDKWAAGATRRQYSPALGGCQVTRLLLGGAVLELWLVAYGRSVRPDHLLDQIVGQGPNLLKIAGGRAAPHILLKVDQGRVGAAEAQAQHPAVAQLAGVALVEQQQPLDGGQSPAHIL